MYRLRFVVPVRQGWEVLQVVTFIKYNVLLLSHVFVYLCTVDFVFGITIRYALLFFFRAGGTSFVLLPLLLPLLRPLLSG